MTTPGRVLAEALNEVGYTETPAGSNKTKFAGEAKHANGQPWCLTFIVAIFTRVGARDLVPAHTAYTPTAADWYRSRGRWSTEPTVGAIAFFDFPDSKKRIQHVGIVESWTGTTVTTIDGNTSSGAGGSEDNGGGVFQRTRPRSHVVGYGLPAYTDEEDEVTQDEIEAAVRKVLREYGAEWDDAGPGGFEEMWRRVKNVEKTMDRVNRWLDKQGAPK